jgi:hypothetical protein
MGVPASATFSSSERQRPVSPEPGREADGVRVSAAEDSFARVATS